MFEQMKFGCRRERICIAFSIFARIVFER